MSLTISLIAVLIPLLFMSDVGAGSFASFPITLGGHDPHFGNCVAYAYAL